MRDLRAFGRPPKLVRGKDAHQTAERNLASRLRKARASGLLTAEDEAELTAMDTLQPAGDAPQLAALVADDRSTSVMQAIRARSSATANPSQRRNTH